MMLLANGSNVGSLTRTVLGKRLDVVKLDVFLVLNRVVVNKAVKCTISALLSKNLLLLGISNLSFKGSHLSHWRRKNHLTSPALVESTHSSLLKGTLNSHTRKR